MLFYMWGATKGFCCNNVVKPDLSWWMLAYWLLLANDFNILVLCDCLLFLVFRWQGQKLSRIKGVVAESELQVVDLCCAGDWAAKAHDRSWLPDNAGYNHDSHMTVWKQDQNPQGMSCPLTKPISGSSGLHRSLDAEEEHTPSQIGSKYYKMFSIGFNREGWLGSRKCFAQKVSSSKIQSNSIIHDRRKFRRF